MRADFTLNDTRTKADFSTSFVHSTGGIEGPVSDKAKGSPTSPVLLSGDGEWRCPIKECAIDVQ
jgi:hypothetical protein